MKKVIVEIEGGIASTRFVSEGVEVLILDRDVSQTYLYYSEDGKELVCKVDTVNEDGTVDITCIDTSDGRRGNKIFRNVDISKLDYFGDDEVDDDDFYLDELED